MSVGGSKDSDVVRRAFAGLVYLSSSVSRCIEMARDHFSDPYLLKCM